MAVALLVALAAWLGRPKALPVLDDAYAKMLLAEEFPGRVIETLWVAVDGRGAVGRSGDLALIIYAAGDGFVARHLPWAHAMASKVQSGKVIIRLGDFAAPHARLAFENWPLGESA